MYDHPLIQQIESMKDQQIFNAVWVGLLGDLEQAADKGEISLAVYQHGARLLTKLYSK